MLLSTKSTWVPKLLVRTKSTFKYHKYLQVLVGTYFNISTSILDQKYFGPKYKY